MILGILSDTHGNLAVTASALDLLARLGAERFVHCGDVGSTAVLDALAARDAWFVWGNTDQGETHLVEHARRSGLRLPAGIPLLLELEGRKLAVFHGHEPQFGRLLDRARRGIPASPDPDYVLFGHSHSRCDERIGGLRLINPGALYRARVLSVATLDLSHGEVHFWRVPTNGFGPGELIANELGATRSGLRAIRP